MSGEGKNIVNLLKLTLPTFDGDILTFQSFWDKFTAIIDSREDLPKVNKFSYLQSVLKGDAKASLQGMSLTASNYDTAKELLQKRFGRREKVHCGTSNSTIGWVYSIQQLEQIGKSGYVSDEFHW